MQKKWKNVPHYLLSFNQYKTFVVLWILEIFLCSVFDWIITSSSLLTNCRVSSLQHAVCGQMCVVTIVVLLSSKYYYTALSLLCWKEKIFFRCSRFTHSTFLCSHGPIHCCTHGSQSSIGSKEINKLCASKVWIQKGCVIEKHYPEKDTWSVMILLELVAWKTELFIKSLILQN